MIGVRHSVDASRARDAAALGFAAVVLKSHDFPSNSVAYAVRANRRWRTSCGSICCDFCVGGLNPGAVETALRDGAAIVWLPTISSQQDVVNGVAALLGIPGRGIELLDERGRLVPAVEEILALVAQYDAIAATGHTSTAEHFALARNFASRGRLVVTHAMNAGAGPQLSVQECIELSQLGAYIELAAATCRAGHGRRWVMCQGHRGHRARDDRIVDRLRLERRATPVPAAVSMRMSLHSGSSGPPKRNCGRWCVTTFAPVTYDR